MFDPKKFTSSVAPSWKESLWGDSFRTLLSCELGFKVRKLTTNVHGETVWAAAKDKDSSKCLVFVANSYHISKIGWCNKSPLHLIKNPRDLDNIPDAHPDLENILSGFRVRFYAPQPGAKPEVSYVKNYNSLVEHALDDYSSTTFSGSELIKVVLRCVG